MSGTVVIDDDDVVMVEEESEIIDLDGQDKSKIHKESIVSIDLDEDVTTVESADTIEQTSRRKSTEIIMDSEKEKSFVMLLKNNTLMNKIVQRCLTMENNSGMSRVVNKTLLPLYQDVDNICKQSEHLSDILNKVLRNLKADPNHKFLHIKALCEELKAKKYRRKVPFITLTTDIKKNPRRSSRIKVKENKKQFKGGNVKTDPIIDLDNSDDEPVITVNDDNDKEQSVNNKTDHQNNDNNGHIGGSSSSDSEADDPHKNDKIINIDDKTSHKNNNNDDDDVKIVEDLGEVTIVDDEDAISNQSNKENKIGEKVNQIEATPDCELLVPNTTVSVEKHSRDFNRAIKIEKQIAAYKERIMDLEAAEVDWDSEASPYMLSHLYKAKVVELYKQLCKLTGNGDVDLKKQRVVRLRVIEGHPPGPVMRLEKFLNGTIDETGSVPLPDFHDVVRCVTQSNIADRLGWSKQEIMKEAIALFTHCGNALRKQRQKREYRDLMTLVRDKQVDDDDPAANNPGLLAKLEENKLIAKVKEEEVLERYVKKQFLPRNSEKFIQQAREMNDRRSSVSFGSDSDSELDLTPNKKVRRKSTNIPVLHKQDIRESSNGELQQVTQSSPSISINNILNDEESRIRNGLNNPNFTNSFIGSYINTIVNATNSTQNSANTTRNSINNINSISSVNSLQCTRSNMHSGNSVNPVNTVLGTSLNQYPLNNMSADNSVNTVYNPVNTIQYPVNNLNAGTSANRIQLPVNRVIAGNPVNSEFSPIITSYCSLNTSPYVVNNINRFDASNIIRHPMNNTNSSVNKVQCPIQVKTVSSINNAYYIPNTTLDNYQNTIRNPVSNTNSASGGASVNIAVNVVNTAAGSFLHLDPSVNTLNTGNITTVIPSNTKQYLINNNNAVSSVNTTSDNSIVAIESTINTTSADSIENPINNIKQETTGIIENTGNESCTDTTQNNINIEPVDVTQNVIKAEPSDDVIENTENTNTTDPTQTIISKTSANTIQSSINIEHGNIIKAEPSDDITENTVNTDTTDPTQAVTSTTTAAVTQNTINNINKQPPANTDTIQNCSNNINTPAQANVEFNTLQTIGVSNRSVNAHDSENTVSSSLEKNVENNNKPPETENRVIEENVTVKPEIKKEPEPLDIPKLLDALGDNYIATIFDVEDPFLVIEVSDSSDDEDL